MKFGTHVNISAKQKQEGNYTTSAKIVISIIALPALKYYMSM